MKRLQRDAILVSLIESLREHGSWCGETHVQKATYLLQSMMRVSIEFGFVLYKHGPFSFDLRNELTAMRADGLLELQVAWGPYGPSLVAAKGGERLKQRFPKTLREHSSVVKFVAERFGDKDVTQLERLATALYVTRSKKGGQSVRDRAEQVHVLKPHVSLDEASKAVATVDEWQSEAEKHLSRQS